MTIKAGVSKARSGPLLSLTRPGVFLFQAEVA